METYTCLCRAFLSPYKDKKGRYKFDGRFNWGVQTLNIPQIALISKGDENLFWRILDERVELIKECALIRYDYLKDATSDVSPIHWQHGGIARLKKGEKIEKYLKNGYSTVTMGYIGLYETSILMTGKTHTSEEGKDFVLKVMNKMRYHVDRLTEETGLKFALYGTPSEATAGRLCNIDKEKFGVIKDVTDKGYYINSYHVDVREDIDVFSKFKFESEFQVISTGGCISYAEIPNMNNNIDALMEIIQYIYETISYAEFNTKLDYCHICSFEGEIIINDNLEWECPQCGNKNQDKMNVVRRT